MEEKIDYAAVLADLEARRDAMDAAIAGIRRILGEEPAIVSARPKSDEEPADIRSDSFLGLSMAESARKYLRMTKRPQTTRQIGDALRAGGLHSTSKNFMTTLYSTLDRQPDMIRVSGKEWGLTAWYPGLKRAKRDRIANGKDHEAEQSTATDETETEKD